MSEAALYSALHNAVLPPLRNMFPALKHRRGTKRAEDAQGTPTQSYISSSIPVYEETNLPGVLLRHGLGEGAYRGTSFIRNYPPPYDHHRGLGISPM